jgi:hypothetical protein
MLHYEPEQESSDDDGVKDISQARRYVVYPPRPHLIEESLLQLEQSQPKLPSRTTQSQSLVLLPPKHFSRYFRYLQ